MTEYFTNIMILLNYYKYFQSERGRVSFTGRAATRMKESSERTVRRDTALRASLPRPALSGHTSTPPQSPRAMRAQRSGASIAVSIPARYCVCVCFFILSTREHYVYVYVFLLSSPSLFLSGVATCLRERGRSTARRGGATAGSGAAVNSTAKASTCSAPSNVAAMFIARYGTL